MKDVVVPGQEKYNSSVTGSALSNSSIQEHRNAILEDLITNGGTFRSFNNTNDGADWVSVFGKNNEDFPKPTQQISLQMMEEIL